MWVFALFDLPVDSKASRKAAAKFRKHLLKDGFQMLQFSVYARNCASRESADVHVARVQEGVPADGQVRVITITDQQFGRMLVFWGKKRRQTEAPPLQLEFF